MVDLSHVPKNPGCYLFKDSKDKIIYVGKAKDLIKRVQSYFAKTHDDSKTNVLVSRIVSVDYIVTDSEVEALILENNLIKKYKPRYNIDLKDSKRYAYIEVTDEEFPRLLLARNKNNKNSKLKAVKSKFYGPFTSGLGRDYVLRVLRNNFKIRTCRKIPKKRCMRFEIGLCFGPCEGMISREDYLANVESCRRVLSGKTKGVVKVLTKRMKMFSGDKDFEKALLVRDQIRAIKDLEGKQKMERGKSYNEDFINWIVYESRVYLILFNSKRGILENKQSFEFEWTPNFLEEFLVQFYSDYDCPREVILPEMVDSGLEDFIKEKGGTIIVPRAGEKVKLLKLVKKNVEVLLFGDNDKIKDLADKLKLNFIPKVIECFDISHLSGTNVVASMVLFRDGKADKGSYRKYKLGGEFGNDDYAAMFEVLNRRYARLVRIRNSGLGDSKEMEMPDLIVVDGGKGQLGVATKVLEELGLKIPVIGLAKKEETVFFPRRSRGVKLDKKGKALKLLIEIRDEAHRFAIAYQRLLRNKKIK